MNNKCTALITRLIEERHRKGLSQTELAKAAHLPQASIGRLETMKTIPKLDTLLKITDALGCELVLVSTENADN